MYCPNCGTESDSKFCPNCGTNLEVSSVSSNADYQPVIPPKKKRTWPKILLAVFGGVLLFVIIVGVVSSMFSATSDKSSQTTSATSEATISPEPTPQENVVTIGNTIYSNSCEVTIDDVQLSYDVLPREKGSFYTHYPADSGEVYIDVAVTVKNVQKQQIRCDGVMKVTAQYNDGYNYSSFPVVEDTTLGFTYANISAIDPLQSQGMRYLIECPQEVEETDNPLAITINLDGENYKYIIR